MYNLSVYNQDKSKWDISHSTLMDCLDEPDEVYWKDPKTKFHCEILRNYFGAFCGYVGLEKSHPYYNKHYFDLEDIFISKCHGGLSFSSFGDTENFNLILDDNDSNSIEEAAIRKLTNSKFWWIGFDCAHFTDLVPKYPITRNATFNATFREAKYRNIQYVQKEVEKLASKLKEVEKKNKLNDNLANAF